jgi:hypothetical protein
MAEYDLISKTALLRHLDMAIDCKDCPRNTDRKTYYERCACSEVADICNTITDFATFVDVQPVVHCKECKYAQNPNDTMVYCTYFECGTMSQNDFCSQGEKP